MRRFLEKLMKSWRRSLLIALGAGVCMALATFAVLLAVDQGRSALDPAGTDAEDAGSPDGGSAAGPKFLLHVNDDVPKEAPERIAEIMRRSVVVYWVKDDLFRFGNGFVLKDGTVVTAAHIVDVVDTAVKVWCDNGEQAGKVTAYDRIRDVAVIDAKCTTPETARFARRRPGLYDQLMATGFSFVRTAPNEVTAVRYFSLTTAIPAARLDKVPEVRNDEEMWTTLVKMRERKLPRHRALCGAAQPGQSGSQVVNEDGAIVGMLVLTVSFHQRTFYVPAVSIRNMLLQEWVIP